MTTLDRKRRRLIEKLKNLNGKLVEIRECGMSGKQAYEKLEPGVTYVNKETLIELVDPSRSAYIEQLSNDLEQAMKIAQAKFNGPVSYVQLETEYFNLLEERNKTDAHQIPVGSAPSSNEVGSGRVLCCRLPDKK